jgi:hypothetical protein
MIKKLFLTLLAGVSLTSPTIPQQQYAVGDTHAELPSGWHLVGTEKDALVFQTKDDRQQATISVLHLTGGATFEEFKQFCDVRIKNERKFIADGFNEPDNPTPFKDADSFGMFYSGGDRKSGRVFSAYFSLKHKEILTVYVEGFGVSPSEHLQSFKAFVAGAKRK